MIIASRGWPLFSDFMWITIALISARTIGMSMNRYIDRHIDRKNPRTLKRHLPQKKIPAMYMVYISFVCILILSFSAFQLNKLSFFLVPLAILFLLIYPYLKRLSWLANLVLGVTGSVDLIGILLSCSVVFWASGFDIVYHCQDVDFYKDEGLYSFAQKFGIPLSLVIARVFDIFAILVLVIVGIVYGMGFYYYLGCIVGSIVLFLKHLDIFRFGLKNLRSTFVFWNISFSFAIFAGVITELLIF
jgi:4-hydroxybenzoate polyprenyltransferase